MFEFKENIIYFFVKIKTFEISAYILNLFLPKNAGNFKMRQQLLCLTSSHTCKPQTTQAAKFMAIMTMQLAAQNVDKI